MRKFIYTLAAIGISFFSFGQDEQTPQKFEDLKPPTLEGEEARNQACKDWNRLTATERLKIYPFDTAVEIRLVSFDFTPDNSGVDHQLPMKKGRVNLSKLKEQSVLKKEQIDSLTYILFNIGYFGEPTVFNTIFCYDPKNAILFLDSKGQVFEFIEICYECEKLRLSSPEIKTGEFCIEKYDLIKAFFSKHGIKFGT